MLEADYKGKFVRENYAQELLIRITQSESNSADIVTIYGQAGSGKSSFIWIYWWFISSWNNFSSFFSSNL